MESEKSNESEYFSLIENTDGSIWSVDSSYCLITGNSAFLSAYEKAYGREPVSGDAVITDKLPDEVFTLWKSFYDRALSGEKFSVEVEPAFHFRGFEEYMEYRFNPVYKNGIITGVTVFGRDISAGKRYLNQIKIINYITEESNKEDNYRRKLQIISDGIRKMFNACTSVIWIAGKHRPDSGEKKYCSGFDINNSGPDNNLVLYPVAVSGVKSLVKDLQQLKYCHILEAVKSSDDTEKGFLFNKSKIVSELMTDDIISRYSIESVAGYKLDIKMESLTGFISVYCRNEILNEDLDLLKTVAEIVSNTIRNNESVNALKKSENLFRQIYENMSIGVAKISMDFRILNANEAYCRMLGYEEEELKGKHLKDITAPEIIEENLKKQGDLAKGLIEHYRMEKVFIDKNKEKVYGILDANLIRDTEGTPSHFFGSVMDITDAKKMEKRLFLDEKMKAIGHLAGGIAHDFNNILSAVIGYADLSLLELPENSPVSDNIKQIKKAGERAKNLVKQILLFSRGSGDIKKNISIASVVKEAVDLLKASIPSSIKISSKYDYISSSVFSDSTKIHEIVVNLCTNSAAALNGKGLITIRVSEKYFENSLEGETGICSPGIYNVLSVKDDGPGIAPEIRDRIFEPFFTTKEAGSGTGMGLSVVFGIVKEHEGNIHVVSLPGKGSEFTIYLPAVSKKDKIVQKDEIEITGGTEHILLVDDEVILCSLLKKMLEKLGYTVTVFSDSTEALKELSENIENYDILITDQTMPDLTGLELSQKILNIKKDFPVILCTGYSSAVDEETVNKAGIKGLLYKPVEKKDIASMLREVIDNKIPGS